MNKPEILIIYGARQVGKTTLLNELIRLHPETVLLNCELLQVAEILERKDLASIRSLFGSYRIICLDEAQKVAEIGSVLKLVYDELPMYKIIATGSSSFELSNKIVEPLTGRNIKFRLFPLSLDEMKKKNGWLWILNELNQMLVFGTYPGIIDLVMPDKQVKLNELSSDYLYQDILVYENIRHPSKLRSLLKALALQVGSQVSVNELAGLVGITRPMVEKYLDLLEKTFVIFRLPSFSKNMRNEIRKSHKFYFYDNGILNALTGNFSMVTSRTDAGLLWENFCISERVKWHSYHQPEKANLYFWRTYDGAEIDLIEEVDGKLKAFEFKWSLRRKAKIPHSFSSTYNVDNLEVVSPNTLHLLNN